VKKAKQISLEVQPTPFLIAKRESEQKGKENKWKKNHGKAYYVPNKKQEQKKKRLRRTQILGEGRGMKD
jgi:hypothetical protein